ncbi:MAG: DUF4255 domain-containing protein [Actinomycetota bacterium]|nr:DUF4255 domain-containing protein [Actinomycetota bacterium]
MLQDVDASLRTLLESSFADEKVTIVFEPPTASWAAEQQDPVLDVFLYDVREALDGRQGEAEDVRDGDGRVVGRQGPPRKYHLSYLVTAWGGGPEQEHRMLGRVLETVPEHDVIPAGFLEGRLVEQGLPVSVRLATSDAAAGPGHAALWSALGNTARTALALTVVAPLVPAMSTELAPPAERMNLGVSREDAPSGAHQRPSERRRETGGQQAAFDGRVVRRWSGVQRSERGPASGSAEASR